MSAAPRAGPNFAAEFEAARARLCFATERAFAEAAGSGPARVAAALRAVFEFASLNPATVRTLTSRALANGPYGAARHQNLLEAAACVLLFCRAGGVESGPPEAIEHLLVGSIAGLLMARLETGRANDLPSLVPEAIDFVLTPFVGAERAKALAAYPAGGERHPRRLG
jgi:hypothetical protein